MKTMNQQSFILDSSEVVRCTMLKGTGEEELFTIETTDGKVRNYSGKYIGTQTWQDRTEHLTQIESLNELKTSFLLVMEQMPIYWDEDSLAEKIVDMTIREYEKNLVSLNSNKFKGDLFVNEKGELIFLN